MRARRSWLGEKSSCAISERRSRKASRKMTNERNKAARNKMFSPLSRNSHNPVGKQELVAHLMWWALSFLVFSSRSIVTEGGLDDDKRQLVICAGGNIKQRYYDSQNVITRAGFTEPSRCVSLFFTLSIIIQKLANFVVQRKVVSTIYSNKIMSPMKGLSRVMMWNKFAVQWLSMTLWRVF